MTQGYRITRFYITESMGSAPTEKQRSKDAHPVEGRGRIQEKLNRLVQMPPQALSQCREENGTGPVRGFIQMNAVEVMTRRI